MLVREVLQARYPSSHPTNGVKTLKKSSFARLWVPVGTATHLQYFLPQKNTEWSDILVPVYIQAVLVCWPLKWELLSYLSDVHDLLPHYNSDRSSSSGQRGCPKKRSGGIVLRMTWKVYAGPKGMCSSGINGGELRGQLANPGSEKKWPLK